MDRRVGGAASVSGEQYGEAVGWHGGDGSLAGGGCGHEVVLLGMIGSMKEGNERLPIRCWPP